MTIIVDGAAVVRSVAEAEGFIARVCFKTGPPRYTGVELEWTVHHLDDPARPLDPSVLTAALGPHAPRTLDPTSPTLPLPGGGLVTVEPGGQVEISTPPAASPALLHSRVDADISALRTLLAGQRLVLGEHGIDAHRPPVTIVQTPRYAAMTRAFQAYRPHGTTMMGSTAGLQVCVDPDATGDRWRAAHTLGPALVAAFANSRRHAGRDTGWASARMRTWLRLDPRRTGPVLRPGRPPTAEAWVRYVLDAPLLCVRRAGERWDAPPDTTFTDWIRGALTPRPTLDDLAYHLTTLFPPVRPRGYLEIRYLDTQPPGEWIAPVTVVTTLLANTETIAEAERRAAPATDRWEAAARDGTADPATGTAARGLLTLALDAMAPDSPARDIVRRRLDQIPAGGAA